MAKLKIRPPKESAGTLDEEKKSEIEVKQTKREPTRNERRAMKNRERRLFKKSVKAFEKAKPVISNQQRLKLKKQGINI